MVTGNEKGCIFLHPCTRSYESHGSHFAFNQLSSQYMKNTPKELADMILGLPRISKELKTLEPYGYHVKSPLSLVQSDNQTDSIVYTSRRFQPYAESFSDHYAFVGPSVFSDAVPDKMKERPLVYKSSRHPTKLRRMPGALFVNMQIFVFLSAFFCYTVLGKL